MQDYQRISNRIVDLVNAELKKNTSPLDIWAGQLLALLSLASTAPSSTPTSFRNVIDAATACVLEMHREGLIADDTTVN
jgi:hypothetical protein